MNTSPAVTVIMSIRNGDPFLSKAIDSVLCQSFVDFEFFITDDGSTDNTAALLSRFASIDKRIRLFSNEKNQGLPFSLNKMAASAKGRYLARMDCDDICHEKRLEIQFNFMEKFIDLDACFSEVNLMSQNGKVICPKWFPKKISRVEAYLPYWNFFVHPTALIRKSSFDLVGGYNENYIRAQDWDLWKRMISAGMKLEIVRHVLLDYRINPKGNSSTMSNSKLKSEKFQHANTLILNKQKFKAIPFMRQVSFIEFFELVIRLFIPMPIYRFSAKYRALASSNSIIRKLLAQEKGK